MVDKSEVKVTPRDHEVLALLGAGASNEDIAIALGITPRTVKQHLRYMFLRAGITHGVRRIQLVKLMVPIGAEIAQLPARVRRKLAKKEIAVATGVWEGMTNAEIAIRLNTSEQVVKNYLRTLFDKLGVWSRLELALYVAGHGGVTWADDPGEAN